MDIPSDPLNPETNAKLRNILQQLTDFIAHYETIEERLEIRARGLETLMLESDKKIQAHLSQIQEILSYYETVMSETGAARFRLNAENILKEGQAHIQKLQEVGQGIVVKIDHEADEFNENVRKMGAQFHETLEKLDLESIKTTAEHSYNLLEEMSLEVVKKVNKTFRGFFWKNLVAVGLMALMIVMLLGQYINDEWPWESHQRILQERAYGADIVAAWNTMDDNVKKYLQDHVFNNPMK